MKTSAGLQPHAQVQPNFACLPAVFSGVGCAKGGLLLREVRPPPPAQSESSTVPPLLQPAPQPLCSLGGKAGQVWKGGQG